jgi:uncharacterized SAM-binding protein YcdF (DUF218 family)
MSAVLSYLFSVTGLTLTLIGVTALSVRRLAPGRARRMIVAATVLYALATFYPVPHLAGRVLTWGYRPFERTDVGSGTTAIVLLGGGDAYVKGWADALTITTPVEAARILEARRVFRLLPDSWIISSGGPPTAPLRSEPSSTVMRDELVRLGVPAERVLLESTSLNTYEEAVLIAPMLASLHVQHVILVTADLHMRRSLGAFRAVGWNALPAIASDPRRPIHRLDWVLPTDRGLDLSSDTAHEVFGIPYYWIRGWWRS